VKAVSVGLLSAVALIAQPVGSGAKPLSVCELIEHRMAYNRRIVTVRGQVRWGPHGDWLAASSECEHRLVTKGVVWPDVIYLAYPNNQDRDLDSHAGFKADLRAIAKDKERLRRAGFDPETDRLYRTYVGLFVTIEDLENRVNPGIPDFERLGFGPLPLGAPAQLLIKTVGDSVFVRPPR